MLSNNFFKDFSDECPVVQILQAATVESDVIILRLRCSDGINSYDQMGFSKRLKRSILDDGLYKGENHPILKILKYRKNGCAIIVESYNVLVSKTQVIGSPKTIQCACHGYGENENLTGFKRTPPEITTLEALVIPINFLTPFLSLRFVIKCTVTVIEKNREIFTKGETVQFLSVLVKDVNENVTHVKAFGDNACRYGNIFDECKCYFIQCDPSCVKPRYNAFDTHLHDYEIVLNQNSIVKLCK